VVYLSLVLSQLVEKFSCERDFAQSFCIFCFFKDKAGFT